MRTQSSLSQRVHRILVLDPVDLARIGLTSILAAVARFAVCASTGDLDEAFGLIERHRPEIVVADPFYPNQDGILWVKDFITRFPKAKLFLATWKSEEAFAERALRSGARGYWMKGGSAESLVQAIDSVLDGRLYVSAFLGSLAMHKLVDPIGRNRSVDHLSDRELHIFSLIAAGHGVGQIARELGISRKTVETHCEHLKQKLHCSNAEELRRSANDSLG